MLAAQSNAFEDLAAGRRRDPDDDVGSLLVRFHKKGVKSDVKTDEESRPIFEELDYIMIATPGDALNIIDRPVNEIDLKRFGNAYHLWKERGVQANNIGTPLEAWPPLSTAQVAMFKYHNVHTVEQLATLSDGNAQKIGPVLNIRQRARDFIEAAKGEAPLIKVRAELEKRDAELDSLKAQLKELKEVQERMGKVSGGGGGQSNGNQQQNQNRGK